MFNINPGGYYKQEAKGAATALSAEIQTHTASGNIAAVQELLTTALPKITEIETGAAGAVTPAERAAKVVDVLSAIESAKQRHNSALLLQRATDAAPSKNDIFAIAANVNAAPAGAGETIASQNIRTEAVLQAKKRIAREHVQAWLRTNTADAAFIAAQKGANPNEWSEGGTDDVINTEFQAQKQVVIDEMVADYQKKLDDGSMTVAQFQAALTNPATNPELLINLKKINPNTKVAKDSLKTWLQTSATDLNGYVTTQKALNPTWNMAGNADAVAEQFRTQKDAVLNEIVAEYAMKLDRGEISEATIRAKIGNPLTNPELRAKLRELAPNANPEMQVGQQAIAGIGGISIGLDNVFDANGNVDPVKVNALITANLGAVGLTADERGVLVQELSDKAIDRRIQIDERESQSRESNQEIYTNSIKANVEGMKRFLKMAGPHAASALISILMGAGMGFAALTGAGIPLAILLGLGTFVGSELIGLNAANLYNAYKGNDNLKAVTAANTALNEARRKILVLARDKRSDQDAKQDLAAKLEGGLWGRKLGIGTEAGVNAIRKNSGIQQIRESRDLIAQLVA